MGNPYLKFSGGGGDTSASPAPPPPPAPPPGEDESPGYRTALKEARHVWAGGDQSEVPFTALNSAFLGQLRPAAADYAYAHTAVSNLISGAQGRHPNYSPAEARRAVAQASREYLDRFGKKHPVGKAASEILGGLATPGVGEANAFLKLKGIPGLVRTGIIGGALGGAQAAGNTEGDLKAKARAVPGGVATGALGGMALHGGGAVVGRTASRLRPLAGRAVEALRGRLDGESAESRAAAAGKRAGTKVVSDLVKRTDPTGERLRADPAERAGKDVTAAEALGRHGMAHMRRALQGGSGQRVAGALTGAAVGAGAGFAKGELTGSRDPGKQAEIGAVGGAALGGAVSPELVGEMAERFGPRIEARMAEMGDRVAGKIASVAGLDSDAIEGDFEASNEKLREKAAPLYQAWHAQRNVDSPELQAIRKTVQFKKAMTHAAELISADRESAFELGLTDEEMGDFLYRRAMALPGESTAASFEANRIPTAKGYDYVKRGLDQSLEKFRDKDTGRLDLSSPEARAILKVRRELNAELTNPDQPWGKAAAAAFKAGGDPLQQEEAFSSAKDLMSNGLRDADFDKRIKKFSPAQMAALRAGVANHARDLARSGRTKLANFLTPLAKDKIRRVFGSVGGGDIIHDLEIERGLERSGKRVAPSPSGDAKELDNRVKFDVLQAYHAAEAARTFWEGHPLRSIIHAFRAMTIHGAGFLSTPEGRAAQEQIAEMLAKSPSELAEVLEREGASAGEAHGVIDTLKNHGFFEAMHRMADTLPARLGGTAGGAMVSSGANRSAQAGSSVAPPAPDASTNPYLKFTGGNAGPDTPDDTASVADKSDARYDEPLPDHSTKATAGDYFSHVLGYPVDVSSAQRTVESNRMAGGVTNSAHLAGEAYDLQPHGVSYEQAALDFAHSGIPFDQIIIEPDNVHVSFDPRFRGQIFYWKKGQGRVAAPSESGGDNLDIMAMGQDAAPDFGADDSTDDDQQ